MAEDTAFEGGCFCGSIRYRGRRPIEVAICHCRDCQHVSGAPMLAWVELDKTDLEWTKGTPVYHQHTSDWPTPVRRSFCGQCGTPLTYERQEPSRIDVTISSLDAPESFRPTHQVYTSSQVSWLHVDADISSYERLRTGPDDY